MGVAEAVTWPSIYSLYSRWVHPDRRASAVGLMNSGISGGSRDCTDLHALANQRLVLAGRLLFMAFWALIWFAVWAPVARSRPAAAPDWARADALAARSLLDDRAV